MQKVSIASTTELHHELQYHGVLFSRWGREGTTKPFSKLLQNIQNGEMELWSDGTQLLYKTRRAQLVILSRIKREHAFLREEKVFHNGLTVSPSEHYSMREKLKFLHGETALEGCVRGLGEELQLFNVDPAMFIPLYEDEGIVHDSRSFPGLLSQTHKTTFLWMMPEELVKRKYVEHCEYCVSRFTWGKVPAHIASLCKPHLKKRAA